MIEVDRRAVEGPMGNWAVNDGVDKHPKELKNPMWNPEKFQRPNLLKKQSKIIFAHQCNQVSQFVESSFCVLLDLFTFSNCLLFNLFSFSIRLFFSLLSFSIYLLLQYVCFFTKVFNLITFLFVQLFNLFSYSTCLVFQFVCNFNFVYIFNLFTFSILFTSKLSCSKLIIFCLILS